MTLPFLIQFTLHNYKQRFYHFYFYITFICGNIKHKASILQATTHRGLKRWLMKIDMLRISNRLHATHYLARLAQCSRKNNIKGILDQYMECPIQMVYKLISQGCQENDFYFSYEHLAAQYTFFYINAIHMTTEAHRNVVCQSNALAVLPDRILSSLEHLKNNGVHFNIDEAFIHTIQFCTAIKTQEDLNNLSNWRGLGKVDSHKPNTGVSFKVFNSPFSNEVDMYAIDMRKMTIYRYSDDQWNQIQSEVIPEEFLSVMKSSYYRAQYESKMASIDGYDYAEKSRHLKGNIYLTKKQKFHAQYAL